MADRQIPPITEFSVLALDRFLEAVAVVDAENGRILHVNRTATEMLGYGRDELLGRFPHEIEPDLPLKTSEQWRSLVDDVRRKGGHAVISASPRRKDGSVAPVLVSLSLTQSLGRELIIATGVDLTEVTGLRARIAALEMSANAVIAAMPDVIMVFSKDGVFLEAYAPSDSLFAIPREGFIGKHADEVLGPVLAKKATEAISRVLATGRLEVFEYEMALHGEPHVWEARFVRKSETEALMVGRDITELKKAHLMLVQREKLASLGEMSASLAHEIRNPLGAMRVALEGAARTISNGPLDSSEKTQTFIRLALESSRRLEAIVDGLGRLSRETSGDPLEVVDLEGLVWNAVALCQERFRSNSAKISVAIPAGTRVFCRPGQIVQILLNLLVNASEALGGQAERWCRVEAGPERSGQDQDWVAISVTDSGRGVPAEVQSRLMQPFFTTKPPGKGTGLGLSISRTLAEANLGELVYDASSRSTRFVLKLRPVTPGQDE